MNPLLPNPLTGWKSSGLRFRFRVRSISSHNLYLPLKMKSIPEINALLNGATPLEVFKCDCLKAAREAFCRLRKRFDFPYCAALDFVIPDKENIDQMVPMRLNSFQYSVVNAIERRMRDDVRSFFLISKTVPRCGLTSCVQAYILWLQKYVLSGDTVAYLPSANDSITYMERVRNFHKQVIVTDIPDALISNSRSIFCFHFKNPDFSWKGRKPSFIHLADMSKWIDPSAKFSSRVFSETLNSLSGDAHSLFIMEGDYPTRKPFCLDDHPDLTVPKTIRYLRLNRIKSNPVFLDTIAQASRPEWYRINYVAL